MGHWGGGGGGGGGYPIQQYRKKHLWQTLGHPLCMFVYLKRVCSRNQPQLLRENVRRTCNYRYTDRKDEFIDATTIPL